MLSAVSTEMVRERGGRVSAGRQSSDVLRRALAERDSDLGVHLDGVADLACATAMRLGVSQEDMEATRQTALLHDVGKVAIPDAILSKPGPLDESEWALIKRHTIVGERIISAAPDLAVVGRFVRSTHERYDGGGYPDGLAGDDIPLIARIVAVCDAYHAMVTKRAYRDARDGSTAIAELRSCSGTQFDPEVAEAFVSELEAVGHPGPVRLDGTITKGEPPRMADRPELEMRDAAGPSVAEERHQAGDQRDQAGQQRDHAGNQRDEAGHERDQAGDQRDQAGDQRDEAGHERDHAGDERDHAGDQRDQAADERDQAADERDQAADERDEAAEQSEARVGAGITTDALSRVTLARREAASDRRRASQDRRAGAGERTHAELDRNTALADRGAGASERTHAELDRNTALADRGAGASERTHSGLDRNTALADRGASARDRKYSSVDDLTGVYLRGAGFMELDREIARARRTEQPLVLAFVDVDHLKAINDSRGHAAGDRMLLEVANVFTSKLRSYDLIIRYGGDEFVCAISGLNMADATKRLALVKAALAEAPEHGAVTIGLAVLQPDDSPEDLVARADAALYRQRQWQRRTPA